MEVLNILCTTEKFVIIFGKKHHHITTIATHPWAFPVTDQLKGFQPFYDDYNIEYLLLFTTISVQTGLENAF